MDVVVIVIQSVAVVLSFLFIIYMVHQKQSLLCTYLLIYSAAVFLNNSRTEISSIIKSLSFIGCTILEVYAKKEDFTRGFANLIEQKHTKIQISGKSYP